MSLGFILFISGFYTLAVNENLIIGFFLLMFGVSLIIVPIVFMNVVEENYWSQGTPEEQLNIKKVVGWYNDEYGIYIRPGEVDMIYEAYHDYLSYRNLTEEEFPIYDFRGDEK